MTHHDSLNRVRNMAIQRAEDIKQRGVDSVAVGPFFVGERHQQVRVALQTVDYAVGPAVTDALIVDGRYHGGDRHRPGSTR